MRILSSFSHIFIWETTSCKIFFLLFILCSIRCFNHISYPSSHIFYYTVNKCPEAEFYVTQTMNIVDLSRSILYPIECTYCVPDWVHIVYPIGYIKGVPDRVLSLNLLSAEPMPYKARLGARFVYPIGYSVYVPDRVQICLYSPYSEGLLEFCIRDIVILLIPRFSYINYPDLI